MLYEATTIPERGEEEQQCNEAGRAPIYRRSEPLPLMKLLPKPSLKIANTQEAASFENSKHAVDQNTAAKQTQVTEQAE